MNIDRLKERLTDPERWRQALQEAAHTFIVLIVLAFAGFVTGWTKLPNLGEVKAFLVASGGAAIAAAAKSFWWILTGTKAPPSPKRNQQGDIGVVEALLAVFLILLIVVVLKEVL